MDELEALASLAKEMGVLTHYVDGLRRPVLVAPETLVRVCAALGAEITRTAEAPHALSAWRASRAEGLPPVMVAWDGRLAPLAMAGQGPVRAELRLESDGVVPLEAVDSEVRAAHTLPFGYHRLVVETGNTVETSTVIVRRALVEEAGGFDPRHRWCEDLDLWLRIALRHEVVFDPVLSVHMRRHPDQLIAEHGRLADALIPVLEGNLERLRRDAPEHAPMAAKALGEIRLRRADRRFREGRPEEAREEIARALALAPSLRAKALAVRIRGKIRRKGRPR